MNIMHVLSNFLQFFKFEEILLNFVCYLVGINKVFVDFK